MRNVLRLCCIHIYYIFRKKKRIFKVLFANTTEGEENVFVYCVRFKNSSRVIWFDCFIATIKQ